MFHQAGLHPPAQAHHLLFQNLLGSKLVHQPLELGFLIFVCPPWILFSGLIYLLFLKLSHLFACILQTRGVLAEEEATWKV